MTADAQDHRLDPVIDFLQRHDHAEASIEIGMRAPEDMDYEYHPASLHLPICGYELGEDEKTGKGMLVVSPTTSAAVCTSTWPASRTSKGAGPLSGLSSTTRPTSRWLPEPFCAGAGRQAPRQDWDAVPPGSFPFTIRCPSCDTEVDVADIGYRLGAMTPPHRDVGASRHAPARE